MNSFVKYMHLERLGTEEVDGIELGTTYVFPKLDGTNGQLWVELSPAGGYELKAGSRNRVLSEEADNAGFYNAMLSESAPEAWNFYQLLNSNPHLTLYGEWLVPHSLKTYREDAWRKFYIFDVYDQTTGEFLHYEDYRELLEHFGITTYLPPIAIVKNGCYEKYEKCLEKATYAIQDGQGIGEGVVIKNYGWKNKFGRTVWAKLIANHFKEKHHAAMGAPVVGSEMLEEKIVREFVTLHLVDKVHAKIVLQHGAWSSKLIGQLLGVVWYDLITEEMWNIIKTHKNPKIDFKTLQRFCTIRVKELKPELF
jgi:hypothetical protein